MLITNKDKVISATEARVISDENKDDSIDRTTLRDLMAQINHYASVGYNEYEQIPMYSLSKPISEAVVEKLKELGYTVQRKVYEKTIYIPHEQHTLRITW